MALFDYSAPQYGRYTNAFNSRDYRKNLAAAEKYDKAVQNYKTYGQAAYGVSSGVASAFGPIGALVGLGIQLTNAGQGIGMAVRQKKLHKRLDKEAMYNETPGFDYGFDPNGQFFETKQTVPRTSLDALLPVQAGLSMGVGALGNYFGQNFNNGSFGFQKTPGGASMGQNSLPSRSSAEVLGNIENPYGQSVIDNPSSDYTNGSINLGNSDEGLYQFKRGGKVVVGGNGDDDIALVEEDSGKDTGVRVSKGEMLVVNKDRLNALKKALKAKDQKQVFNIIKAQVNEPVKGKKFADGGIEDIGLTEDGYGGGLLGQDIYGIQNANIPMPQIPAFAKTAQEEAVQGAQGNGGRWRDGLENGLGFGFDAYRMIEGLHGANTKVPEFHKSGDWVDYLQRLKLQSQYGFSPAEAANFRTQQDRTYATDVANIYNLSGGSNAIALGNLGRANTQNYLGNMGFAAADAAQQRANLASYGGAVGQDMGYNRQIFDDKLNQVMLTKQAGAGLARDARMNMEQRNLTNRFYGKGSQQDALQNAYLQRIQNENDITAMNLDRWRKNPNAFSPYTGNAGDWNADREEKVINGETYVKKPKTSKVIDGETWVLESKTKKKE